MRQLIVSEGTGGYIYLCTVHARYYPMAAVLHFAFYASTFALCTLRQLLTHHAPPYYAGLLHR